MPPSVARMSEATSGDDRQSSMPLPDIASLIRATKLLDRAPRRCVLEHSHGRRRAGEAELAPARHYLLVHWLRQFCALGEVFDVTVIHARIDQRLGAPRPDFRRIEARIQKRAPGLAQDVDRLG